MFQIKDSHGFSLMEMVMVMAITGIMSGTLYMKFSTNRNSDDNYYTRASNNQLIRLAGLLKSVQMAAMNQQKTYGIRIGQENIKSGKMINGKYIQDAHTVISIVDANQKMVSLPGLPTGKLEEISDSYSSGTTFLISGSNPGGTYGIYFDKDGVPMDGLSQIFEDNKIIKSTISNSKYYDNKYNSIYILIRPVTGFISIEKQFSSNK